MEGPLRVGYLRAEMASHSVADVAAAVDLVCAAAEQAEPHARELLVAIVDLLTEAQLASFAQLLREEAAGRSLLSLARLLRRPAPAPSSSRRGVMQAVAARIPDYGAGRPLTLGERKALARRPSRAGFEKLLADPHPAVIRALLANPKMVEDDVIRLAARRPASGEILAEIAMSRRWAHRVRVRLTIVLNPDSPPELSVPLVGLLMSPELRLVASSADLPAVVRAAARDLLARRPPMHPHREGASKAPVH